MKNKLSEKLYFPLSKYLRVFARAVLRRWHPTVIAVTGSAGKSTAHALIYTLFQKKYRIQRSHKANSAFGVPLDILGIHLYRYGFRQWLSALLLAPLYASALILFPPRAKFYLVELDVDRPGEMEFFTKFLHPKVIFWVSSSATHTANFDTLAKKQNVSSADLVAEEFAKLLKHAGKKTLALLNADSRTLFKAVGKITNGAKLYLREGQGRYSFQEWQIMRKRTVFKLVVDNETIMLDLPYIVPRNFGYTALALFVLGKRYGFTNNDISQTLAEYISLPGRTSLLSGIHETRILDSTYNSSAGSVISLLEVLHALPGSRKIAVLGDMRELGVLAQSEHEAIAQELLKYRFEHVVLVGPLMNEFVAPKLQSAGYDETSLHTFTNSYQAGLFIKERLIKAGDSLLVKASQNTLYFELIVEMLLADKKDVNLLCRREPIWEAKRAEIKQEFYNSLTPQ